MATKESLSQVIFFKEALILICRSFVSHLVIIFLQLEYIEEYTVYQYFIDIKDRSSYTLSGKKQYLY